jgi:muconolactone delta-isomerase
MKQYMVDIDLPEFMTEEFLAMIPRQREQIKTLLHEGKIVNYALALDRSKLWTIILAESEDEVMEILSTFPLIHFMTPEIYELAFNNRTQRLPMFSLN